MPETPTEPIALTTTLICAKAHKETADMMAGVTIGKSETGELIVSKMREESLFAETGLKPGMSLISINGISMDGSTPILATTAIKETVGDIVILASTKQIPPFNLVVAAANKEAADTKIGVSIGGTKGGNLVITKISDESLFAKSDLKVGMRIRAINNVNVDSRSPDDALLIIKLAVGPISILAQKA
jgi:C-terminal processing protease CtpA/Prc